jgi:hypothetical protein
MQLSKVTEISLSGYNRGDKNNPNSCNGGPPRTSSSSCDNSGQAPGRDLQITVQPSMLTYIFGHTNKYQGMKHESILQMGTDRMIPRYVYHKPFTDNFPDKGE